MRLAAGDGILRVAREEGVGTGTVWRDQARDGCCVVVMKARDPEAARQRMADFDARVLPIILELRDQGMSINVIARILTARHIAAQPGRHHGIR